MFLPNDRVICVDDRNPNPLCFFPEGYVVHGHVYQVRGMSPGGGVQIVGRAVISFLTGFEVGWKPHRFRKFNEKTDSADIEDLEYTEVGAL